MVSRDNSIDFFKGLTVLSIVFIHTVWWSGQTYVPNLVAQCSLLFDVPVFFFLSGASAVFTFSKPNPFSGIVRMVGVFVFVFCLYALIFERDKLLEFLFRSSFIHFPWVPQMEVLSSSMWFVPVLFLVYIIGFITVKLIEDKRIQLSMCAALLLLLNQYDYLSYLSSIQIFGVTPDYIFAYLFFFLSGYIFYQHYRDNEKVWWFAIFSFCLSLMICIFYFYAEPFNLQQYKFPPRLKYVICSFLSISIIIFFFKRVKKVSILQYLSRQAIFFYAAQGISSGWMYYLLPHLRMFWPVKLLIILIVNIIVTIILARFLSELYRIFFRSVDGLISLWK